MERKNFVVLIAVLALSFFLAPLNFVCHAVSSDSLVMVLVENHDENQIEVDVKMVTNTGVSGMTLELVYDKSALVFIGYEKGDALSKLDLMATNYEANGDLPVKFNWFNKNGEVANDESEGVILKLRFLLKDGVKRGKFSIGFKYSDGDVIYVDNGNVATKSALIGKVLITVADSEISKTEVVDGKVEEDGGLDLLTIVSIVVIALALVTITVILVAKNLKTKKDKGKWTEI